MLMIHSAGAKMSAHFKRDGRRDASLCCREEGVGSDMVKMEQSLIRDVGEKKSKDDPFQVSESTKNPCKRNVRSYPCSLDFTL